MQNVLKLFFAFVISGGILNSAEAQPTRHFSERSNRPTRQTTSRPAPVRSFSSRNSEPRVTQNTSRNVPSRNATVINSSERVTVYRNRDNVYSRNMQNNYRYNNSYRYSNNYRYTDYRNHYYGNVYGRRTVFMYGPRYRIIPHSFISINFGGYPYYYNHGCFYGYYAGYYQPIFPPFGLRIRVLPFGYSTFFVGSIPFYYYNGIYYRQYDNSIYEVTDAPMGATVSALPKGARSVIINGEKLYELNGTYYKSDRDANGNDVFIVVGKNGVINNTADARLNDAVGQEQINQNPTSESLEIGDTISQLPEGSKIVTVNGQQLYETPDNIYLQEESVNGSVDYKVVGK